MAIIVVILWVSVCAASACDRFAMHQALFYSGTGLPEDQVVSIVTPTTDRAFIGLKSKGVVIIDKGKILPRGLPFPGKAADANAAQLRIKAMAVDENNQLWVGTANGLYVFGIDDLELRSEYGADCGFADNVIQSVAAADGDVIVGTTRGAASRKGGWKFVTEKDGMPTDLANAVSIKKADALQIGTANGVAVISGNVATKVGLPGQWVNAVCPCQPAGTAQEETLAAITLKTLRTLKAQLEQYEAERLERGLDEKNALAPVFAAITRYIAMLQPEGVEESFFYAGSNMGTFRVDPSTKSTRPVFDGWTIALAVDQSGGLYAGQRGLKIQQLHPIDDRLSVLNIEWMIREHAAAILTGAAVATPASFVDLGGIASASTPINPSNTSGLGSSATPSEPELLKKLAKSEITAITVDRRGTIWVGTSDAGAYRFLPVTVNAEQPIHVLEAENREEEKALASAARALNPDQPPPPYVFRFYTVAAPPPEIEDEVKPMILEAMSQWAEPGKYQFWIGRWSQLTPADREQYLTRLARFGDACHLQRYMPLFFHDAFVTLPIGWGAKGPPNDDR